MKFFIFILFVTLYSVSGLEHTSKNETGIPWCFQFTWLVDTYDEDKNPLNCSDPSFKNIPCIEQSIVNLSPPNFTEIWTNRSLLSKYGCILKGEESCIKYSYRFNDAIINSTYFCAKAVEDMVTPIVNGCFSQMIEGHNIETCVCRSTGFGMPCNSSTKNFQSFILNSLLIGFIYFFSQNLMTMN